MRRNSKTDIEGTKDEYILYKNEDEEYEERLYYKLCGEIWNLPKGKEAH